MNDAASAQPPDEATALLHPNNPAHARANSRPRIFAYMAPVLIVLIALGAVLFTKQPSLWISGGRLPDDPREAADVILSRTPVIVRSAFLLFVFCPLVEWRFLPLPFLRCLFYLVHGRDFASDQRQDGHIDLAWLARLEYKNNATAIDLDKPMPGEVDIPRLRAGHVGGFFWCVNLRFPVPSRVPILRSSLILWACRSIYVPCPESNGEDPGEDFLKATSSVR